MSTSVKKNYIYNLAYQLVSIGIPIVTMPYLSRVLGVKGIGIYTYTLSVVQYFILFGTLGIPLYANKTIAYSKHERNKLRDLFWEITILQLFISAIALIAFFIFFLINKNYKAIYLIQSINILAGAADISWFFMGMEDFRKTASRNIFVKIIGTVLIFIFVKSSSDVGIYTFINAITLFVGQIIMWLYIYDDIRKFSLKGLHIKRHFKPVLILFIPQISIQVYMVLNKIMLGAICNTDEVGLFDQSQKLIRIFLTVVTSLGTVMLPRMASMYAIGDTKKFGDYLNKSFMFMSFLSIPMTLGLIAVTPSMVPWFLGPEFNKVILLTIISSAIIIVISWGNVLGTQYLLAVNRNREYTISVAAGALVNLVLNIFLVKFFASTGAVIATLITEIVIMLIQIYYSKEVLKYITFRKTSAYFIVSVIMAIVVLLIGKAMGANIKATIVQVLVGGLIYIVAMLAIKDEMLYSVLKFLKLKK